MVVTPPLAWLQLLLFLINHECNPTPPRPAPLPPPAPQVDLVLDLVERKTGGLSAGGGLSAAGSGEGAWPGLIGSFSYNERNLFGLNQRLSVSAEIGQVGEAGGERREEGGGRRAGTQGLGGGEGGAGPCFKRDGKKRVPNTPATDWWPLSVISSYTPCRMCLTCV